ncbi:hypothetical protein L9F63_021284, partial [Diploptera punctata]
FVVHFQLPLVQEKFGTTDLLRLSSSGMYRVCHVLALDLIVIYVSRDSKIFQYLTSPGFDRSISFLLSGMRLCILNSLVSNISVDFPCYRLQSICRSWLYSLIAQSHVCVFPLVFFSSVPTFPMSLTSIRCPFVMTIFNVCIGVRAFAKIDSTKTSLIL